MNMFFPYDPCKMALPLDGKWTDLSKNITLSNCLAMTACRHQATTRGWQNFNTEWESIKIICGLTGKEKPD